MSQSDFSLKILGIKSPNINVIDVKDSDELKKKSKDENDSNESVTLVFAKLSYPIESCREYEMELWKKRYRCKNCNVTFGAQTSLAAKNQALSTHLKNQIMLLAREGLTGKFIARTCRCSPSSVRLTIVERMKPHYRMARLPNHLCFDEFRSTQSTISFICCDAETHQLVTKLHDRLSSSIIAYFENRYSSMERVKVKTVVIGLNAQYQSFIYRLFPNAKIIIYRFHIIQLAGRALNNCRISIMKQLDKHTREYKIMKSQWKLFHFKTKDLHPEKPVYLWGVNEYMTRQNAVDLITNKFSDFMMVYQTYQDITTALQSRNKELLITTLSDYQTTHSEMDITINTLRKNQKYVLNSIKYKYSNGPLEGINRKIKNLKRSCYGFANQNFFFLRIDCIFA